MAADQNPGQEEGEEEHKCPKVRRQKHHGGHHGGAWKVAFADFMTAMMALFLLLWLLASSSESQKAGMASYFKDPGIFKSQNSQTLAEGVKVTEGEKDSRSITKEKSSESEEDKDGGKDGGKKGADEATLDSMTASVNAAMKTGDGRMSGYIQITRRKDSLRVTMVNGPTNAFFYPGTARTTKALRDFLTNLSDGLALIKGTELVITGHTDSTPLKTRNGYGNFDLSSDRASAVKRILAQQGVPESRFRELVGRGASKPIFEDGRDPRNQRVTLDIFWVEEEDE